MVNAQAVYHHHQDLPFIRDLDFTLLRSVLTDYLENVGVLHLLFVKHVKLCIASSSRPIYSPPTMHRRFILFRGPSAIFDTDR